MKIVFFRNNVNTFQRSKALLPRETLHQGSTLLKIKMRVTSGNPLLK